MAKKQTDKFQVRWERLRKRSRRRYIGSIIALVLVVIMGGTLLAILIHLEINGLLSGITAILQAFLVARDVDITLVIFWILAIPCVLILINIVNLVRKLRFRNYRRTWEETAKLAIEEEKHEYKLRQEKLKRTKRFGTLNDIVAPAEARRGQKINSLKELCDGFRDYSASELKLYYTRGQIREFVASLAVSRILIVQGMSVLR